MCNRWSHQLAVCAISDFIVLRRNIVSSAEMLLQEVLLEWSRMQSGDGTPRCRS
jgi:hypothetical protein